MMGKCFLTSHFKLLDLIILQVESSLLKIGVEDVLEMVVFIMISLRFGDLNIPFPWEQPCEIYWLQLLCLPLFLVIRQHLDESDLSLIPWFTIAKEILPRK